ncbi:MAG: hypothetical protein H5U20_02415 [Rhodobacteraceae bacterium]|nr:hypothetical protein [Paracoccaceae bacterium]
MTSLTDKIEAEFAAVTVRRIERMLAAADEIAECYRVLRKGGLNVVGEVLKGQGQFVQLDHYPKGDIYDPETHSQFYYHAHRPGEHGHFHLFLRARGMPPAARPVADAAGRDWPTGDKALAHLVAISMDKAGYPIKLFTTNRWVTGETWYPGPQVQAMVDFFEIDHAYPSWPTNRWATAMVRLFRPQIRALIAERDLEFERQRARHPGVDIYEEKSVEVLSEVEIDVDAQTARLRKLAQAAVD